MTQSIASPTRASTPQKPAWMIAQQRIDALLHSRRRSKQQERQVQEYLREIREVPCMRRVAKPRPPGRSRARAKHTQRRARASASGSDPDGGDPDPAEPELAPDLDHVADRWLGKGARSARFRATCLQGPCADTFLETQTDPLCIAEAAGARSKIKRPAVTIERSGWAAICSIYTGRDRDIAILSCQLGPAETKEIARQIGLTARAVRYAQERVLLWVQNNTTPGDLHDATDAHPLDFDNEIVERRPPTRRGRKPKVRLQDGAVARVTATKPGGLQLDMWGGA